MMMKKKDANEKKKVLFITTGLGVGGAERVLSRLIFELKEEYNIEIISLLGSGVFASKIRNMGIRVYELDFNKIYLMPFYLYKFFSIACKFKPEIIHGWMYHGNLFAFLARLVCARLAGLFFGIRQSLECLAVEKKMSRVVIYLNSFFSKFVDRVVYNSYAGRKTHEDYGFCKEKSIVICNGIDVDSFLPSKDNHDLLCDELGISRDGFLIGIVGRYHPVKDHATFVRAASRFLSNNSRAHFVMVGLGVDCNNKDLMDLIAEYPELKSHVHMLGVREDVAYINSALDISTNCSLSEGFSNTICEALACGVICVATDVGDSKAIIGDERFIVPIKSPEKLSNVWKLVINMPQDERSLCSRVLRERIVNNYSVDLMVSKYKKLLRG